MCIKIFQIYLFVSFFLLLPVLLFAQDPVVQHDTLYSSILKEKRPLEIVFPSGYKPDAPDKYEIVYVLDGTSNFARLEWDFLQGEGFLPKNMIMIGVEDTFKGDINSRDRDFTPTQTSPISGGAAKFLSFFKEELIPYAEQKYHAKTSGHTLYGGSLGGLFVMYAFLNEPKLFTSYIAIDPSLWWDNFYLNKVAGKKLDSIRNFHNTLWIAGREGSPSHFMGTAGMDSVLRAKQPHGLDWKCTLYANETHYSTNFKGFYEGLKFSYGGFYASTGGYNTSRNIFIKPQNGIVLKSKPFQLLCYNLVPDQYIHYTTDGAEPVRSSPKLAGDITMLTLNQNSTLRFKSIGTRAEYDKTDSAKFITEPALPAAARPKAVKPGGLRYAYYEGGYQKNIKPIRTGIAGKDFDINQFGKQKDFVCVMEGFIAIEKKGYYIFEMGDGNDHSSVFLNGLQLLGLHFVPGKGESFMLPLEKGFYPFNITYVYKKGGDDLVPIYIKPEGADDFPVPAEMLYSSR